MQQSISYFLNNMNIAQLTILIAEKNDENAFKQLFYKFYAGLLSFATSIIKDQHMAEEVVEDVFIKLWENRETLPTITNLSYYLYVATKHASLNCIQKRKREKAIPMSGFEDAFQFGFGNPASQMISGENLRAINAAISNLPPRCRLIFRLIKSEGLSYAQVSTLLNISVKTVEAQMTIALKKLGERLIYDLSEYTDYFKKKVESSDNNH